MNLKDKIRSIYNESTGLDPSGGVAPSSNVTKGTSPGLNPNTHKQTLASDANRKRVERQAESREQKLKRHEKEQQAIKKGDTPPHPRMYLNSELRLTLHESFVAYLVEYLNTGRSKYMMDAFKLMEEYPTLKKFVQQTSQAALPQQSFSVYAAREHLDEEVGSPAYRSGNNPHNWTLTHHQALENASHLHHAMVMEAKITPDKALIYIPAFTKLMENLIFSGKIEEPQENVIRKAKNQNELVLPPSIDTGLVMHIKK